MPANDILSATSSAMPANDAYQKHHAMPANDILSETSSAMPANDNLSETSSAMPANDTVSNTSISLKAIPKILDLSDTNTMSELEHDTEQLYNLLQKSVQ